MNDTRFKVLVADPPWRHADPLPGPGRGAAKHYRLLSVEEICAFPLPPLADPCLLVLWRVSSMVEEAYRVCRAWGFVPKSELVWKKLTRDGKRWFGMGRYVRAEHETAIIALRGEPSAMRSELNHSIRSVFEAPAGRHSEKPREFYELVERLHPGPYAELFARRDRPGWVCFGDELPAPRNAARDSLVARRSARIIRGVA
jgi:N6-adenosine-specific RNA methylase IME4